MPELGYVGSELDLFAGVHHWKSYWADQIRPFLAGDVLEVGAGIGSNAGYLRHAGTGRHVCLEPDSKLAAKIREGHQAFPCDVVCGTLRSLREEPSFETIVYVDVLEHVEDDRAELVHASRLLKPGGRVIVVAPAHDWLFTPFDAAIGHYRRYDRRMIRAISPAELELEVCRYLDAIGMILSGANRLLLRQSLPTARQLRFWDSVIVPLSRGLDPVLFHAFGKSILAVWRKCK